MLTCPCELQNLAPHFYVAKRGFTGVYRYYFFLIDPQNIDRRGGSNLTLTLILALI